MNGDKAAVAFDVVEELDSGEFWYSDIDAWGRWLDEVDASIRYHDAWALLAMRPNTDVVIIDVFEGWRDRMRRFNARSVRVLRKVEP